jgi:hypothetical protein
VARWACGAGPTSPGALLLQAVATLLLLVLALGLAGSPARAADEPDVVDPPARVGRVARVEGWVSLLNQDSNDAVEAPRNWPLTTGDTVSTGADARAELRIGSTVLRLGEHARLRFVRLDDDAVELQLQRGSLGVLLSSSEAARELSITGTAGRFVPQGEGFYRIDASPVPGATAWRSALQVDQAGASFTLSPGQYAQLFVEGGWRMGSPVSDDFARWSMRADAAPASSETALLPPDMTGAEDLREHGDWQRSDDWGMVWFPRAVAADWAPYREGRWAWVAPWGWTWVDDAPWGFAPFHYGRWVHWRGRWGWCPGDYRHRPVYSPALVAWVDQPAPGASINFGRSMVWFPLGPREVFVPTYRATPRYREGVNLPYRRQPLPREDERRFDHGPRHIGAAPVYRYAQTEMARSVLPRTLFEQARRPIDAQRRRDDPPRTQLQPGQRETLPDRGADRGGDRGASRGQDRGQDRRPDITPDRQFERGRDERDRLERNNRNDRDNRGAPARPQAPVPAAPAAPVQQQQRDAPQLAPAPALQPAPTPAPATPVPTPQPRIDRGDNRNDHRGNDRGNDRGRDRAVGQPAPVGTAPAAPVQQSAPAQAPPVARPMVPTPRAPAVPAATPVPAPAAVAPVSPAAPVVVKPEAPAPDKRNHGIDNDRRQKRGDELR